MKRIPGEKTPHVFREERGLRHVRDSTERAQQTPPEHRAHRSALQHRPGPAKRRRSPGWGPGGGGQGQHRPGGDTTGRWHEGTPPLAATARGHHPETPEVTARSRGIQTPGSGTGRVPSPGLSPHRAVSRIATRGPRPLWAPREGEGPHSLRSTPAVGRLVLLAGRDRCSVVPHLVCTGA